MPCWLVVWLNELLVIVVDEFLCWKLWEVLKEIGPRDLNNFFTRRQVLSSSFSCVWKNMTRTYHMYMHSRSLQSTIHCPMRHTLPPRFLNGREARHAITLDFYCVCIDIFYHHDIDLCNILWSIITLLLTVLKQISSMNNIVIRMRREWVVESYLYRDTHRLNTLSTTQQAQRLPTLCKNRVPPWVYPGVGHHQVHTPQSGRHISEMSLYHSSVYCVLTWQIMKAQAIYSCAG